MPEITNPENNSKMNEIEELERQLAEKKAAINIEGTIGSRIEKRAEISHENVAEAQIPQATATPIAVASKQDENKRREIMEDTKSIALMDEGKRIETLVTLALEKGIMHSIEVANSLKDPYILDMLHDKLIGELHDKLVKENKLKDL